MVLFGPFFLFAIFTFIRGLNWIRTPALIWAVCSLQGLGLVIAEDFFGVYATHHTSPVIYGYYGFHIVMALTVLYRTYSPFPFGGYIRLVNAA